jgi:hypothetical protein
MGVPQYTTPTFQLTFTEEGLDLTQSQNVYVTFRSGQAKLTKTGDSLIIGEKTIGVKLTQSETARFAVGSVRIQANWTTSNGDRAASEVVSCRITEQLLTEVVE